MRREHTFALVSSREEPSFQLEAHAEDAVHINMVHGCMVGLDSDTSYSKYQVVCSAYV